MKRLADRIAKREDATMHRAHEGVVIAATHDEAVQEIERRIAEGRFDVRFGALVVPPDDESIEAWEQRQRERPPQL